MRSEKIKDLNFLGCAGNILTIGLNSIVIEVDLKSVKVKNGRLLRSIAESS